MEKRHIGKVIKAFPSHLMSFEIKSQVPGWGEKFFVFKQGSGCFSRWLKRWIRKFPDITLSSLHPTHQLQTTFFHHFFCISHSHSQIVQIYTWTIWKFSQPRSKLIWMSELGCVWTKQLLVQLYKIKIANFVIHFLRRSSSAETLNVPLALLSMFFSFQKIWHDSICVSLCYICPFKHREF